MSSIPASLSDKTRRVLGFRVPVAILSPKYGDVVCCFPRSLVTWLGVAYKYKPFQLELNSNFIPERSFRAEFLFSFVGMRLNCANCLEEE